MQTGAQRHRNYFTFIGTIILLFVTFCMVLAKITGNYRPTYHVHVHGSDLLSASMALKVLDSRQVH